MEKKYLIEHGIIKKVFVCQQNQLKDMVKKAFKIQGSFQFHVYDEDFKEWAAVTNIGHLPAISRLKVLVGKIKLFIHLLFALR